MARATPPATPVCSRTRQRRSVPGPGHVRDLAAPGHTDVDGRRMRAATWPCHCDRLVCLALRHAAHGPHRRGRGHERVRRVVGGAVLDVAA